MKQGFMLIELIIATLIASMVAAILLAALAQSNRFMTIVDNLVDTSVRVGVASHQLEKDLMGAFIPVQAKPLDTPAGQALGASGADASSAQGNKQTEKKGVAQELSEQKGAGSTPKAKIIEKIFYSTNKNGQFDTLTFITNNPLVVYVGQDVGTVKPKVVRVQYTLKPEADKKNSFALFRQESNELDLEQYKNVTAYELIGGIRSCNMTFTACIEKKQEEAKASAEKTPEKPKVEYEYKTQNEWVSEQKKESSFANATQNGADKKEKEEFPRIPYSVEIKMILWDLQDKREREFTIVCQIPTDFAEPEESPEPEKKPQQDNKKEDKAAQDKNKEQQQTAQHVQTESTQYQVIAVNDVEKWIAQLGNITKNLTRM
jgi:hypothetical protein